jgi:molybdenum cofactor biosynthesis protein MoaC
VHSHRPRQRPQYSSGRHIAQNSALRRPVESFGFPYAFLNAATMPTVASTRAFSSRCHSQKEAVVSWYPSSQDDDNAPEQTPVRYILPAPTAAETRGQEQKLLRNIWAHGIKEYPLPLSYEAVRQKYKMTDPEYDYYWRLAAGGQMLSKAKPTHMGTKAQRKLREIQDAKREQEGGRFKPQELAVTHKILMHEARELFWSRREAMAQGTTSTKTVSAETTEHALSVLEKGFGSRVAHFGAVFNPDPVGTKDVETANNSAEHNSASKQSSSPAAYNFTLFGTNKVTTTDGLLNPKVSLKTALATAKRVLIKFKEEKCSTDQIRAQNKKIRELNKLRKQEQQIHKMKTDAARIARRDERRAAKEEQAEAYGVAGGNPVTDMRDAGLIEAARKAQRDERRAAKLERAKADSGAGSNPATSKWVVALLEAAKKELKEFPTLETRTIDAADVELEKESPTDPKTQITEASVVGSDAEAQENIKRQEEIRAAKLELLRKKQELLQQLQAAKEIPRHTIAAEKLEDKLQSFELDDVLYSAHHKLNPKTRGPKLAESPGDMVYRPPITPAPRSSLTASDAHTSTSMKEPTLGNLSQSKMIEEAEDGLHISSIRPGLRVLSNKPIEDNIRINVSSSGEIRIDSDLTLQLNADLPNLRSQVSQMQNRLKSSFPRIDTLPYDVSEKENKRTLQTWLKVLAGRWRARYDKGESQENLTEVDVRVRSVMDQMVRDHDLSNAAAKRMTEKWLEVSRRRGVITGDVSRAMDLDELDADGMSFRNKHEVEEMDVGEHSELQGVTIAAQRTDLPQPIAFETSSPEHGGETDVTEVATHHDHIDVIRMGLPQNDTSTISQSDKITASTTPHIVNPQTTSRRAYSTSSRTPPEPTTTPKPTPPSPSLPHLTSSGSAHMVSVSTKQHTVRTAIAVGTVYFSNAIPLSLIQSNSLKKGDVLSVSRIAGIMAAKKCPDLIPLCHPIALTHVGVELQVFEANATAAEARDDMNFGGVSIEAKVECTGPTGVEMEALTSVMGCALSVVDMCKAVDKFQRVGDVRVVLKEGGKSGVWREEGWRSFQK